MNAIYARNFSAGYRRLEVFSGVDFDLPAGTIALLGPNGAGKTTLMNAIAGLDRGYSGTMSVLGLDRREGSNTKELARRVGYLAQNPGFDPRMTVTQHVAYCGWLKGLAGPELAKATLQSIAQVNLADNARKRMGRLSGGMRRRAAIAGVLVADPELVVLDEPTAGLDPAQRVAFKQIISVLSAKATVLLSTHLVEDVVELCDYIAVLVEGAFVFTGVTGDFGKPDQGASQAVRLERAYLQAVSGSPG